MSVQSTPTCEKKREASSPLLEDDIDLKKSRMLSGECSMMDAATTNIQLSDEQITKISDVLKTTFDGQISAMVTSIVSGVLGGLEEKVKHLEDENANLRTRVEELENSVAFIDSQRDKAEQYSRRNCLRISGIPESPSESTDQIVIDLAAAVGADIKLDAIDRMHRLGKKPVPTEAPSSSKPTRPRDIIVKLATYRARHNLYEQKAKLKFCGYKNTFINENLTRARSELYYLTRQLVKAKMIHGTWTSDGVIIVKPVDGFDVRLRRIETMGDLKNLKTYTQSKEFVKSKKAIKSKTSTS